MNYYYDVLINMNDSYPHEFYEWSDTDLIEQIKKIPIFKVSSKVILDVLKYKLRFIGDVLDKIYMKTEMAGSNTHKKIDYAILLTDTKNSLVVELDNLGNVLCLSGLEVSDEINLYEIAASLKEKSLTYKKGGLREIRKCSRIEEEVRSLLTLEIKTLYESKSFVKLRYLYYEWMNVMEADDEVVYDKLRELIRGKFSDKHKYISELVKLSYKK